MFRIHVKTYERTPTSWRLVLEHTFVGKTLREALHYSESHAETDSFYRDSGGANAARILRHFAGARAITYGSYKGITTRSDAEVSKR